MHMKEKQNMDKIIVPPTDPPSEKKMHWLKNWSPPGIEPWSMA